MFYDEQAPFLNHDQENYTEKILHLILTPENNRLAKVKNL